MSSAPLPVLHAAAAILRRGDAIVVVRQAGPGEEPFWALPGEVLEDGELVAECLVREVREETGIVVEDVGRLAFAAQLAVMRSDWKFDEGYHLTVWTFEVAAWSGEFAPADPDGFVTAAELVPEDEAIALLDASGRHGLTVRYLRGEIEPGSVVLQRWHAGGRVEDVGPIPPP